ncbi:MAG TPA: DUF4255 domain-containing protein [Verrucomicrobiae bacterium]|nr:DUF4255 domain-containing protein [Verrucomicrobiae bacterium]
MSNYLAVATVTATLQRELQSVIGTDVPGATAFMHRPDAPANMPGAGVNIFLYQIAPNAALRNVDLPTRDSDGPARQRPKAVLDLYYLMSFYGKENRLEPQRVLGSVVRHLHSHPLLTQQMIRDALADKAYSAYLAASNLADAIEPVRFTPLGLSLEELSKLWSVFFQTPYTLSAAYRASFVLVEEELTPQSALPVLQRQAYVLPFNQLVIEQVSSDTPPEADPRITLSSTLVLKGRGLKGPLTFVRLGDLELPPQTPPPDLTVSNTQISFPLATLTTLRAGVQAVQVVHKLRMGNPAADHRGFESNVAAFVLHPTITVSDPAGVSQKKVNGVTLFAATITVKFVPNVDKSQRVTLLLNELNAPNTRPSHDYSFAAPKDNGIPTPSTPPIPLDTPTIAFAISGLLAGDYVVRVQVDGAESLPDTDTDKNSPSFRQYLGTPKVSFP